MDTNMADDWMSSDDELLRELAAALRDDAGVPRSVVESGRIAFAWNDRYADAEFAALAFDSVLDRELVETRTETARVRSIVFTSARHRIELEISDAAIRGQLIPPQVARIEVLTQAAAQAETTADEDGWFTLPWLPAVPFQLLFHTAAGSVLTHLIQPPDDA
jgi:hypothetical protein